MIQLDIRKEDLLDDDKLQEIVRDIFLIKNITHNSQQRIKTAFDFYRGDLPYFIDENETGYQSRNFNLAKPIVETATKTFIGVLPDIVTTGKKSEKEKISVFNQKLYTRHFNTRIYQAAKNSSVCGSGFVAIYNKLGDTFPRFRELNPQFADVVYDSSLAQERLFAFNIVPVSRIENNIKKEFNQIYIYTDNDIITFEAPSVATSKNATTSPANKNLNIAPLMSFRVGDKETNRMPHGYSDIPIFEFPNNEEYKGDFECVEDLFFAYNDLQNNRCLNVHDIVNYVLMLKNVRIGSEEEQEDLVNLLQKHRILPIEGENVEAKYLSNPLNQNELDTLAQAIKTNIHYICRVPDLSSVDFSQNASDPIIKIKTKPLLDLCCEKELSFSEPYLKLLKCVLDWCKVNDKQSYGTYDFVLDLCSLKYSHPLPANDVDMVTQIANLANAKVLDPATALQEISWINNVHDYQKGIEKWNEIIKSLAPQKENDNNKGVNQTNIDRQNSNPRSTGEFDNKNNGALGAGNKIG